jgi:signal peptidase I
MTNLAQVSEAMTVGAEGVGTAKLEGSVDPSSNASSPFRAIGRALRWLIDGILGLLMLVLIVMTFGPKLYPFDTFYVRTGSMVPTISVGALVIATQAPASSLGVGDIIVFPRPDRRDMMVVHRIAALENGPDGPVFLTKGDANDAPDDWRVPATGSGWHYRASIPGLGFAVGWLRIALSKQGWVGALAIVVGVWALVSIWQTPEPE